MSKKCDLVQNIGPMAGNNVSHSNRRTKRVFSPNLHTMSFHSNVLNVNITLKVASKTLRTINKYGSLDSFLVNYGYSKLSEKGKKLRRKVMKKLIETGKIEDVKILREKKNKEA